MCGEWGRGKGVGGFGGGGRMEYEDIDKFFENVIKLRIFFFLFGKTVYQKTFLSIQIGGGG